MTERYGCDEWWESYPGASNYQFSAAGRVRSVPRMTSHGRPVAGAILATRPNNKPDGAPPERRYRLTDIRMDDGTRKTVSVHTGVLLSHTPDGRRPDGMQACHNDDHPGHNWWANLRWDDPDGNRQDRLDRERAQGIIYRPAATFPCRNHARCGGMARRRGRRCEPCSAEAGQRAAVMLHDRRNLATVAQTLGYRNQEWVYALAVRHGGYTGTIAEARHQHPRWSQRVMFTFRDILGWRKSDTDQAKRDAA